MPGFRRPAIFYAITMLLALIVAGAAPYLGEASTLLTMFTPAIGVAVMLAFVAPEGGFRTVMADLGLTTAGLKGWPLAILGPAGILFLGLAILVAVGATTVAATDMSGTWVKILVNITAGLGISTVLAAFEEVGWRGYLLPRMVGMPMVAAALVVGFLHGLWHLPLLLTTDFYHSSGNPWIVAPMFVLTLTLAGLFYGFLRVWTGSVWPVAIAHGAANMAWNISAGLSQVRSPLVLEYVGGESGLIMIGGLIAVDLVLIRIMRRNADAGGAFRTRHAPVGS